MSWVLVEYWVWVWVCLICWVFELGLWLGYLEKDNLYHNKISLVFGF